MFKIDLKLDMKDGSRLHFEWGAIKWGCGQAITQHPCIPSQPFPDLVASPPYKNGTLHRNEFTIRTIKYKPTTRKYVNWQSNEK